VNACTDQYFLAAAVHRLGQVARIGVRAVFRESCVLSGGVLSSRANGRLTVRHGNQTGTGVAPSRTGASNQRSVHRPMIASTQLEDSRAWSAGTCRSGIGRPANRRRHGTAIHRARRAERLTRALSVAMPVFAYIWR
jgi:hypothetical protein